MTPLEEARSRLIPCGKVAVAFSGGKDSLATLDLAVSALGVGNVVAWHMHLVPDLECEERPLRAAVARYPGLVIVRVPHWNLSRLLRSGYLNPHWSNQRLRTPKLSLLDVETHVLAKVGFSWAAYGHRADESLQRRAMLSAKTGQDRRCYPIQDWSAKDVVSYLTSRRIELPPKIGRGAGAPVTLSDGVGLTPDELYNLRENHPDDFEKVCRVFTLAPAAADAGARRAQANAVSAVPKGRRRSKRDPGVPEEPAEDHGGSEEAPGGQPPHSG